MFWLALIPIAQKMMSQGQEAKARSQEADQDSRAKKLALRATQFDIPPLADATGPNSAPDNLPDNPIDEARMKSS